MDFINYVSFVENESIQKLAINLERKLITSRDFKIKFTIIDWKLLSYVVI